MEWAEFNEMKFLGATVRYSAGRSIVRLGPVHRNGVLFVNVQLNTPTTAAPPLIGFAFMQPGAVQMQSARKALIKFITDCAYKLQLITTYS